MTIKEAPDKILGSEWEKRCETKKVAIRFAMAKIHLSRLSGEECKVIEAEFKSMPA